MYASDFALMNEPEVANLRYARLIQLLPQFIFDPRSFDAGQTIYVRGPGIALLCPVYATAEDCDNFTASGLLFAKMFEKGLISEAVLSNLLERH